MRKLILILYVFAGALTAWAEDSIPEYHPVLVYPQILKDMKHATVQQDSSITLLMEERHAGIVRGVKEGDGYRVQIYSSSKPQVAKAEALRIEQEVTSKIDVPVYVTYTPPFWKVRLGDFKSMDEAKAFKDQFKELFPNMQAYTYVVRDKIILSK